MKTIDQWFDEYGESHQNPTNKLVHWICVPVIFFSIVGLLSAIPAEGLKDFFPGSLRPYIHWGTVLIVGGMLFYLRLSLSISAGMLLISGVILYLIKLLNLADISVLWLSVALFVLAWIGQFWGHKIEGKKPSFLKDLQFLMIGPIWLLGFVYRKLGINY